MDMKSTSMLSKLLPKDDYDEDNQDKDDDAGDDPLLIHTEGNINKRKNS